MSNPLFLKQKLFQQIDTNWSSALLNFVLNFKMWKKLQKSWFPRQPMNWELFKVINSYFRNNISINTSVLNIVTDVGESFGPSFKVIIDVRDVCISVTPSASIKSFDTASISRFPSIHTIFLIFALRRVFHHKITSVLSVKGILRWVSGTITELRLRI